jgi:5-methylcytosine-specific restriction endonuclease McrA
MKICYKCGEEKELIDFTKNKESKDGYRNICKICSNVNKRESNHRIKENNPEAFKLKKQGYKKTYRSVEKNKIKERIADKLHSSLESTKKRKNARHVERYNTDPVYKMRGLVSCKIYHALKGIKETKYNNKTMKVLGCSIQDFIQYIELQFEPWMDWYTHGNYTGNYNETWQLDHIKPISLGMTIEEVLELSHYTNLQPLCSRKNKEKSNKYQEL